MVMYLIKKLKTKKLLIVTNVYPSNEKLLIGDIFVKEQIDEISNYFKEIIVISPQPYFPPILKYFPGIPKEYKEKLNYTDYRYKNIKIYYPRFFLIPFKPFTNNLGDISSNAVFDFINKKKIKFDIIHSHFIWKSGYIGNELKSKFKKKFILTTHDLHKTRLLDLINKGAIDIFNNADVIINVAEKYNELLKKEGINTKCVFIPNIVDTNTFCPKKVKKSSKKIIISVGNLIEKKGFEFLIASLNLLRKKRSDFACYIIGGGPLEKKLKKQVIDLNLTNHVYFLGPIKNKDLVYWYNFADVFVLNSFVESFGVVNIESLSCGTPVISTINGGSEYVITNDDLGFLIRSPKNIKQLSRYIDKALNKKWNKKIMRTYAKRFNKKKIVKKIINLYAGEIINEKNNNFRN